MKNPVIAIGVDGGGSSTYDRKGAYEMLKELEQEAEKSYRRFIAALSEGPVLPPQVGKDGGDSLISEIATAFLAHIESRNMDKTDLGHFKTAIGYLVETYGELSGNEFSPKKLKAVRSQMVKAGTLCRNTVNKYTKYIKRIFSWGVEEELVNANIGLGLRAVKALREGEEGTFDHGCVQV